MISSVNQVKPDLIFCPFLTKKVPEEIYKAQRPCVIVHPGIKGDRGISSLDWALLRGTNEWGVTLLQADEKMDAGAIWSSKNFKVPEKSTKSSLYQSAVVTNAVEAMKETLYKYENGIAPEPLDYSKPDVKGTLNPRMKDSQREVNWEEESSEEILRKIWSADGNPGALGEIQGKKLRLFNAHLDETMNGRADAMKLRPGEIIGQRNDAICIKTKDSAIWIGHLKRDDHIKLPAMYYLRSQNIQKLPEESLFIEGEPQGYQEIFCNVKDEIATVNFRFLNGAMNTDQCKRLKAALEIIAKRQDVKIVVLKGSKNYFSNGINLNTIQAANDLPQESWNNINAINDCVKSVFSMTDKVTVAYIEGNAGAGGAMMPLAADFVFVNPGSVLNPHYKGMGLYGSEYWTYFLTRRVGNETALKLTEELHPVLGRNMISTGMVDRVITSEEDYQEAIMEIKSRYNEIIMKKITERNSEWFNTVEKAREKELKIMKGNFQHQDYQKSVYNFVYKTPPKTLCSLKYFQDTPIKRKIDCKSFVEETIEKEIKPKVALFKERYGKTPGVGIIQVGNNAASTVYVQRKMKIFAEHGFHIECKNIPIENEDTKERLIEQIRRYNKSSAIHGIVLQLPLPKDLDNVKLFDEIDPEKDIDGFHSSNMAKILVSGISSAKDFILPCTVRGVIELINYYNIKVQGKTVAMVGKGMTVGLPLSTYLMAQGATVISCDIHTANLDEKLSMADIIITGCGSRILAHAIRPNTIVLDVGTRVATNEQNEKKIIGDVCTKSLKHGYYTPVPGGLGTITVTMAMLNTIEAFERIEEKRLAESRKQVVTEIEFSKSLKEII